MCHGAPSEKVFERYVDETFGKENLKEFHFRTKRYGYNCTTCEAVFKNGKKYVGGIEFDPFVLGFTRSLFLRRTCESCKYASFPRQGDLTMGDFWGFPCIREILMMDVVLLWFWPIMQRERQFWSLLKTV